MDRQTFQVRFGNSEFSDDFGFSGQGTVSVDEQNLLYAGKKRWAGWKQATIFFGILVGCGLVGFIVDGNTPAASGGFISLGIFVGLVIGFIALVFCASQTTNAIALASICDVKRDERVIRFTVSYD